MRLRVTMEAEDEVHFFPHAPRLVPADGVEVLLAEQAERAGDDETASQAVPAEPAEQERAQVLDHSDAREEAPGDPGVVHAAVLHRAAVGDADRAADRGALAAAQEGPSETEQREGAEQELRVHRE